MRPYTPLRVVTVFCPTTSTGVSNQCRDGTYGLASHRHRGKLNRVITCRLPFELRLLRYLLGRYAISMPEGGSARGVTTAPQPVGWPRHMCQRAGQGW